jgi:hypothetical protein
VGRKFQVGGMKEEKMEIRKNHLTMVFNKSIVSLVRLTQIFLIPFAIKISATRYIFPQLCVYSLQDAVGSSHDPLFVD